MTFAILDQTEVLLVARTVHACERMQLTAVARTATRLGNGWLYPILTLLLLLLGIDRPLRFVAAVATSVLAAFIIYPELKTSLGRTRPCNLAPSLMRGSEPLDRYSCPSGHAMTATAFAIPLMFAWPAATPLALTICLVIGWSRVALGHHYVSDVLAGMLLGAMIAGPVSAYLY
jgi:undecaprenyl-diphosphatase